MGEDFLSRIGSLGKIMESCLAFRDRAYRGSFETEALILGTGMAHSAHAPPTGATDGDCNTRRKKKQKNVRLKEPDASARRCFGSPSPLMRRQTLTKGKVPTCARGLPC